MWSEKFTKPQNTAQTGIAAKLHIKFQEDKIKAVLFLFGEKLEDSHDKDNGPDTQNRKETTMFS